MSILIYVCTATACCHLCSRWLCLWMCSESAVTPPHRLTFTHSDSNWIPYSSIIYTWWNENIIFVFIVHFYPLVIIFNSYLFIYFCSIRGAVQRRRARQWCWRRHKERRWRRLRRVTAGDGEWGDEGGGHGCGSSLHLQIWTTAKQ